MDTTTSTRSPSRSGTAAARTPNWLDASTPSSMSPSLFDRGHPVDLRTESEQVAPTICSPACRGQSGPVRPGLHANSRRYEPVDHRRPGPSSPGCGQFLTLRSRWVLTDTRWSGTRRFWLGKYRAARCGILPGDHAAGGSGDAILPDQRAQPGRVAPIDVFRLYRRRWDIERPSRRSKRDLRTGLDLGEPVELIPGPDRGGVAAGGGRAGPGSPWTTVAGTARSSCCRSWPPMPDEGRGRVGSRGRRERVDRDHPAGAPGDAGHPEPPPLAAAAGRSAHLAHPRYAGKA